MANPNHLEILKRGVAEWNVWITQDGNEWPDLCGANLRGVNLTQANLTSADLTRAVLTALTSAKLTNAVLTGAQLTGASLTKAKLTGAVLRYANLPYADLSGADLRRADFRCSDLSGAKLTSAMLDSADLRDAEQTGANLTGASLRRAELSGANLTGANLNGADLVGADLAGANLTGASLNGAELTGTNFTGTNLHGADLHEAHLCETVFGGTDLSGAKGLDACRHRRRSTIDLRTLQKSGRLPEVFLRGCGLPEEFITYLPSFLNQPNQFCSCFISYNHGDQAFARLLHDRLQSQGICCWLDAHQLLPDHDPHDHIGQGIRCWLDEHSLVPGDNLHDRIDHNIRLWDKVLLCASQSSLTSWWVDDEINRAFQKEAQVMKQRDKKVLAVIPLNLDGFMFSADYQSGKKAEITSRVAANFVGWEQDHALFDRELAKVILALKMDNAGREKPPPPKL